MSNKHLQHVKSNVVNNGSPKLPTTEQILLGEIGINYAHDYERMSIKNDANEIVEFAPKKYLVGKNEIDKLVAEAIQNAMSAVPPTEDQEALLKALYEALTKAIQDALAAVDPTVDQEALLKAISDAITKAIADAISAIDPTADQEALMKAIYETITKAIQEAIAAENPTVDQEALLKAIADAVAKAIADAISAIDPTADQEALIRSIYEALTKAIQEALAAENPTVDQEALLKAIADAVAKAIADALDPQAEDRTIIEQIENIIENYVYTDGGTSISLIEVMTNSHTHRNKSVLDSITQENITSWNNAASGGVTNVGYNTTTKEITQTIGGSTTAVVNLSSLKSDMNLSKSDVGLGNVTNDEQVKASEKGVANGVAELDANGKVPSSQLPSYVDDVIEGYYYNSKFYKEAAHTTLITGESDKIYVDLSKDTTYRCSNVINQTYTQIKGDLALGETETTAYRGDRGKIAYDHSQAAHAPVNATVTSASTTNGNIKIDGTETTVYTHPSFTAQTAAAKKVGMNDQGHVVLGDSLTASDVGLGSVGNFKAVSTVANQGLSATEQLNARNNIGAGTSSLEIGTTATTAAAGNHTHGNIGNGGTLTDTAAAAAGNDYVVIRDASDNKIQTSTIKGTDVADAVTNKHSHNNKSVLDSITQEKMESWDNASSGGVTNVAYDATNKKITKTVGGETTDVVTTDTLKSDMGLDKVGNFKAVSTAESQGLTSTEQANARANIGAGTSSFSGNYNDLTNKIVFNSTYNATNNKAATMSDIPTVPSHGTAASGGTTESVVTTGEMYNWNAAYSEMSFLTGSNTASAISSIAVDKRLVICTATSGQFSLASLPPAGREIHVLVTPTSAASLTIPHGVVTNEGVSVTYVNTNDAASGSMSVSANKCGEINAISDGTKVYIRYVNAD